LEQVTMTNRLREIEALGQSIWIDNLNRPLLDDGTLRSLIDRDGISGVTSNPTIFEKGMGHSDRYDEAFRKAARETQDPQGIFERLAYGDVRDAADLLRPTFEEAEGQDGHVSFELPAALADDAEGSIEAGERHRDALDRQNVLMKVPGTQAGVRAFEELTARGVNVNVTLLFAVSRYQQVAEAYLRGLERRVDAGQPVDRIASVASFFVSRVDTKIDAALRTRRAWRAPWPGRGGQRQDRLRVFPPHLLRTKVGTPRGGWGQPPTPVVGLDVDEKPRLPGHALRRRADRPRHRQHHARRHD
jgi:transaldolase